MGAEEEIECKFLEINVAKLEAQLKILGAKRQYKRLFKRYVFDFPDLRLDAVNSWVRVRDEGDRVRLGFKQRQGVSAGKNDEGMKEVEVTVDDFEGTVNILRSIGMTPKFYEENWRTLYYLDGVELMIDEWPLIPPYLEIEADSWQKVDAMATKLGFDLKEKRIYSTMQVYKDYGIDELDYETMTFESQIKKK